MQIDRNMDAERIAKEIASRVKQTRILLPMTQEELANKACISIGTLRRFESGEDISFQKLIQIMAALNLSENLELLVPDQLNRPQIRIIKERKRAVKNRKKNVDWKWGDEK